MNTIDSVVEQLSFIGNIATQYKIAIALQGAESGEAGIIALRSAWNRKKAALKRQLEAERRGKIQTTTSKPTRSTAGTQPRRVPRTISEFNALTYSERLWVHDIEPEVYRRYTGRATKAEIMAIKDPDERQAAIACNLHLFLDREP